MVEKDLQKPKQQIENLEQYQTTSLHFGPHKQDKIYSVQRETLRDGFKLLSDTYENIYSVYNQELLTTKDKYGRKNALQILIRLLAIQLAVEDALLIPMAHDILEDGFRWSEMCRNGIQTMKDMMVQLWKSIGTSEFTDETDKMVHQLFDDKLEKHKDVILKSILPLLSDKLTPFQKDTMYQLISNANALEKHFPMSELNMNWLTGHDMNLFEKFVEEIKKDKHHIEKTTFSPKLGYHK